jgi:2-polyprenyl-3-methyl-5-hydroxy-6-metoxy-1,4-benzoquinol methylase
MLNHESQVRSLSATTTVAEHDQHSGCRFCGSQLRQVFLDLGLSPMANSYLKEEDLQQEEPRFPLRVYVCGECFLVQLEEWESPENIFGDYAYFSSYSESWLRHAKKYVGEMIERFGIDPQSQVVEIASNDGYLLQYFVDRGIPVLGVEPARNVAVVARSRGIPTRVDFFGETTARTLRREGLRADLLIGNNVLAHVPNLNDFVKGLKILLADQGVVTMEFPHLARLCAECQIDTIYHEHFSYFSFVVAEKIFAAHGLTLFDVEELPTHGGSLRIFAQHKVGGRHPISGHVEDLRKREIDAGYADLARYLAFEERAVRTKEKLIEFLVNAKQEGKRVIGYGAPAKGNTLLNYCGVTSDLVEYTVDRSPHKQGLFLPGTRIPIYEPERINATKPDYILILPWNLQDEIISQLSFARTWGAQFVVPIPEPRIIQ